MKVDEDTQGINNVSGEITLINFKMAIYAITGRPRHGKTMEMVRIGIELLKNKERVFSNVKLNLGIGALKKLKEDIIGDYANEIDRSNPEKLLFYWTNMHEWEHFEKGTILCDELQRYFNARRWDALSEDTELKLQQHGKDDLDIYGTTQYYTRIDKALRELVEVWYDVKTVIGNPDNLNPFLGLKFFKITTVEGIEFFEHYMNMQINPNLQLEIPHRNSYRRFRRKIAIAYDTRAKIGRSEPMPLVHKIRECNYPGCNKKLITHD